MNEKLSKEDAKTGSFIADTTSVLPAYEFETFKRLALCDPNAYFGLRQQLLARFINTSQGSFGELRGFQTELDAVRLSASNPHLAMGALAEKSLAHAQLLQKLVACLDRELQVSVALAPSGRRKCQDGKSELADNKTPSSSA